MSINAEAFCRLLRECSDADCKRRLKIYKEAFKESNDAVRANWEAYWDFMPFEQYKAKHRIWELEYEAAFNTQTG